MKEPASSTIAPHGGNRRLAALRFSRDPAELIDFSSNINPLGPPPVVEKILRSGLDSLIHYPDPQCQTLKDILAQNVHIPPDHILPGNGSAQLLHLLTRILQPRKALIPEPNFSEYRLALTNQTINSPLSFDPAAEITHIMGTEKNGFKIPIEKLILNVQGHDILFLSSPNNPVGYTYSRQELIQLIKTCEAHKCYLLVDEAFIHFTPRWEHNSVADLVPQYPHLIVLQAFTKIFALPGLRLGMIYAAPKLIEGMARCQPPWSVNGLAQEIGAAVFSDKDYIYRSILFIESQRRHLFKKINQIDGFSCFPSQANYLLCKLTGPLKLVDLENHLGKKGIMIRNCSNYPALNENFFRIAVRGIEDNRKLLEAL